VGLAAAVVATPAGADPVSLDVSYAFKSDIVMAGQVQDSQDSGCVTHWSDLANFSGNTHYAVSLPDSGPPGAAVGGQLVSPIGALEIIDEYRAVDPGDGICKATGGTDCHGSIEAGGQPQLTITPAGKGQVTLTIQATRLATAEPCTDAEGFTDSFPPHDFAVFTTTSLPGSLAARITMPEVVLRSGSQTIAVASHQYVSNPLSDCTQASSNEFLIERGGVPPNNVCQQFVLSRGPSTLTIVVDGCPEPEEGAMQSPACIKKEEKKEHKFDAMEKHKDAKHQAKEAKACRNHKHKQPPEVCEMLQFFADAWEQDAKAEDRAAADPPDSNFQVLAKPKKTKVRKIRHRGFKRLNRLVANYARIASLEQAWVTSIERSTGAVQAKNATWVNKQSNAARSLGLQIEKLLRAQPKLVKKAKKELRKAGLRPFGILTSKRLAKGDAAALRAFQAFRGV
jgi:hypothetical protein